MMNGPVTGTKRRNISPETAALIRRLRLDEKLPVAEVATRVGVSEGVVSKVASDKPLSAENEAIAQRLIAGESQSVIVRSMDPDGRSLGKNASRVSGVFRRIAAEGRITDSGKKAPVARPTKVTPLEAVMGSHREAVLIYLQEHDGATTGKEIAQALDTSITKVEHAIDGLRKAGKISAEHTSGAAGHSSSNRLGTSLTGDHRAWINIKLVKSNGTAKDHTAEDARVAADIRDAHLRDVVLRTLAARDEPFGETSDLRAAIRGEVPALEYYDLQKLLTQMEGHGLIRCRHDRVGKRNLLKRIAITEAGARSIGVQLYAATGPKRATDATDPRNHPTVATGGEIIRESAAEHAARYPEHGHQMPASAVPNGPVPEWIEPTMEAQPPEGDLPVVETVNDYPLLAALRTKIFRANARADLIRRAAELAEDGDERAELELLADATGSVVFSAVEKEYLAFAEGRL